MFPPFRGGLPPACRLVMLLAIPVAAALVLAIIIAHAQTQFSPANQGVIRLKVRYKSSAGMKDLARKRFFLIKGSLEQNRPLVEKIKQTDVPARECYYRSRGASDLLIKWLAENDCDSVYCREVEEKYVSGAEAVPEFRTAYDQALRELKASELARRWLANYLPIEIRNGYYLAKQQAIAGLTTQAESSTGKPVMSIMTDRKGTAYLTAIEPGTYTISNLVPSATEKSSILWVCEREVKPTDLGVAMKRPLMLSNEKDAKVKCEIIERPLPTCNK